MLASIFKRISILFCMLVHCLLHCALNHAVGVFTIGLSVLRFVATEFVPSLPKTYMYHVYWLQKLTETDFNKVCGQAECQLRAKQMFFAHKYFNTRLYYAD